ncbi:acetyltransferase [Flagellimonas aquimarina]|uniref:Acetyltransferase n=1 Tax=Flagellimonas aquimarina TaxID=2201895 RepID=A0A316LJJ1_9FLAO|nr:ACT domain-containing protein [Allomuricauda koreensis]PWL40290.1 acetyltransferase [Allomuricauda koreensis]
MSGETNLVAILSKMKPVLHEESYVFVSVPESFQIDLTVVHGTFKEKEGITLILKKENADKLHLNYDYIASCITLMVHSSLQSVGLTAAVSNALAEKQISCNVVAAYYHDHIFIDKLDAKKAMDVLLKLTHTTKLKL